MKFHRCRIFPVSRGRGAHAVALAAHRHAAEMQVAAGWPASGCGANAGAPAHSEIILPGDAPAWAVQAYGPQAFADAHAQALAAGQDRSDAERAAWVRLSERLWCDIEHVEDTRNRQPHRARLAWEVDAEMPPTLCPKSRIRLVRTWTREAFGPHRTAIDCVIRDGRAGNPRALLALPTRPLDADGWGPRNRRHGRWNWIHWLRTAWTRHVTLALERECPGTAAGAERSEE